MLHVYRLNPIHIQINFHNCLIVVLVYRQNFHYEETPLVHVKVFPELFQSLPSACATHIYNTCLQVLLC